MQSDDNFSRGPERKGGNTPGDRGPRQPRPLKREAMMLVTERQRGGVIVAFCSLAGASLGFGLGAYVSANSNNHCLKKPVPHYRSSARVLPAPRPALSWLGVEVGATEGGAEVKEVVPDSPAEAAGLQRGDTITRVGSQVVTGPSALVRAVQERPIGARVVIAVVRSGGLEQVPVTLSSISPLELRKLQR